jgi:hypothetical protein
MTEPSSALPARSYARFYRSVLWPAWERVIRQRETVGFLRFL